MEQTTTTDRRQDSPERRLIVKQRVLAVLANHYGTLDTKDPETETKTMADLGMDSLDAVEFIMRIEDEFGIEIPDEKAEKLTSMGVIIDYVTKHLPTI